MPFIYYKLPCKNKLGEQLSRDNTNAIDTTHLHGSLWLASPGKHNAEEM